MTTHVNKLQNTALSVHIVHDKLGEFTISASAAQLEAAQKLAVLGTSGALGLAELLGKGNLRFEAMDSEFEAGHARRRGSLFVHVPALGPIPLRVRFHDGQARGAEELLEHNGSYAATKAGLIAEALNKPGGSITAHTAPETGLSRG